MVTVFICPGPVVRTGEHQPGEDLNHYYDPAEWPHAYCGIDISDHEDVEYADVDCLVCLDLETGEPS